MAKIPKHKRIKRATVLIKRTRCVKNVKSKICTPIYKKLKVNNHSLARALSQEKQDSQLLFTKNIQLLSEVQDLAIACHSRDIVISNVLKNAKDMMQILVTMSGYLTNTISCCQELVSNPNNTHRTSSSSSSPGHRESLKRLSTKSPAKGVVKPMVSGHTITKPTINLSRVNMQRLQNVNLSIIEEGQTTPERNLNVSVRSSDRRRSRLPERLSRSSLRTDNDDDRVTINKKSNRRSVTRISSGRFSKRDSGRLSETGSLMNRLSMCNPEYSELIRSPRVALQDVSRYLSNSQTVNIHNLGKRSILPQNDTNIEENQLSESSSPESSSNSSVTPASQESCKVTEAEHKKKKMSSIKKHFKQNSKKKFLSQGSTGMESDYIDPKEGPSWLFDSDVPSEIEVQNKNTSDQSEIDDSEQERESSPLSSLEHRRSSNCFRIPKLPKSLQKVSKTKLTSNYEILPNNNRGCNLNATSFCRDEDDDDDEDDNHNVNLCQFITRRRGNSTRTNSVNCSFNGVDNNDDGDDDDDDDETMMMNIKSQLRPDLQQNKPECLQFDMKELLQLTPLRPLLKIQDNNGPSQIEPDVEQTATIQITQRIHRPQEVPEVLNGLITSPPGEIKSPELPKESEEDTENEPPSPFSKPSSVRISSRIELPRITDINPETFNDTYQQSKFLNTEDKKEPEKRKRVPKNILNEMSASEDEDHPLAQKKKIPRQRKKKNELKDPSSAKVVLQKLNDSNHNENSRLGRNNSEESVSSLRNSVLSQVDASSDSECSTASSNSRQISMRPRRQKAPKNLQEPCLNKKLRRIC